MAHENQNPQRKGRSDIRSSREKIKRTFVLRDDRHIANFKKKKSCKEKDPSEAPNHMRLKTQNQTQARKIWDYLLLILAC